MSTILLVGFLGLLVLGVPIAFAMGLAGLMAIWYQGALPWLLIPQRALIGADSYALLAIPFFILAGNLMNQGGITQRIIGFANAVVGRFRGGLALSNVFGSMLFAGVSGSAVADSTALGKILVPAMKRERYDADFSAAVTAASSTCGPIIPPSIPLVIYGLSVGETVTIAGLFLGGVVPGFLLGICLMLLTAVMSWRRGYPIHPPTGFLGVLRSASRAGWAMGMPVLILVGVTGGIVTVTEAAALCVAYALLVGLLLHRDLKLGHIMPVLAQTALDTALVMIVVAMANGFGWLMAVSGLPRDAANLIASVSDDPMVILLLINALLLIVGCVMEAIAAMIILIPVLIPVVKAVGIDLTHFGVVMVFNLMLGLITPPVGLLLFINSNFAEIPVTATIRAVFPFLACALVVLLLITLVPDFVLLLPRMFGAV